MRAESYGPRRARLARPGAGDQPCCWSAAACSPRATPARRTSPSRIDTSQANRPISPLIYGLNSPSAAHAGRHQGRPRPPGRQPLDGLQLGDQRLQRRQRLLLRERQLPDARRPRRARPSSPRCPQAKAAGAAAIVTIPIVDYVAGDKQAVCNVQNTAELPGAALQAEPADQGLGLLAHAEPERRLRCTRTSSSTGSSRRCPGAERAHPARQRARPVELDPRRGAPDAGDLRRARAARRDLRRRRSRRCGPRSKVLGPVNYGCEGFVNLQNATDAGGRRQLPRLLPDPDGDGRRPSTGQRLIDDLDVHWYPEATGGGHRITDDASGDGAAEIAAREQAPRSLWDPTYTENSWITNDVLHGPIDLHPVDPGQDRGRLPGHRAVDHRVELRRRQGDQRRHRRRRRAGHLRPAGRDRRRPTGRWFATRPSPWPPSRPSATTTVNGALLRRHLGPGHRAATPSTATVYASMNQANHNQVMIIAINKATTAKKAAIKLTAESVFKSAKVYTVTSGSGHARRPAAGITTVGPERLPLHDAAAVDLDHRPRPLSLPDWARPDRVRCPVRRGVRAWRRGGRGSRGRPGTSRDHGSGSTSCRTAR